MRIEFKDVLDLISKKTGINKNNITLSAQFEPANVDVGKNCDSWIAKRVCVNDFNKNLSRGLLVSIYANGHEVFSFYGNDIDPNTHDINELMRVDYSCGCVGPGFYSYSPYLILDNRCDKKDIKKFVEAISFDPNKTEVVFYPNCRNYGQDMTTEHKKFLKTLPPKAISKLFFKEIKCDKLAQTNTSRKAKTEPVL